MKGKRVDIRELKKDLETFLSKENTFLFGFYEEEGRFVHKFFKKDLRGFTLFNPFFSTNGALFLRRIFSKDRRILLLMRPCEVRAFVELSKVNQLERDAFIAISIDCFGTISERKKEKSSIDPFDLSHLKGFMENSLNLRFACKICKDRRAIFGDLGLRINEDGHLYLLPYTEKGSEFFDQIGGVEEEFELVEEKENGEEKFKTDLETMRKEFERCIMCMNCKDMCPICYCVDCLFNGDEYLPKAEALLNKIERTGSKDVTFGKEIYHLIRMYHVSQSCVGCGACEEACPMEIPLTKYFKGVSQRIQSIFSYKAGRSFEEPLPFTIYEEKELEDAED